MKIIKSVETIEVPNNNYRLPVGMFGFEEVHGRNFHTTNGDCVLIGMTQEVENELGIVMHSIETITNEMRDSETRAFESTVKYNNLKKHIKSLTWKQRLGFLFKVDVLEL